jgi:hypothetical protein
MSPVNGSGECVSDVELTGSSTRQVFGDRHHANSWGMTQLICLYFIYLFMVYLTTLSVAQTIWCPLICLV